MPPPTRRWELALDQPGSADDRVVRHVLAFAAVVALVGACIVVLGDIPLSPFPPFAIFQGGFVFLVDLITAFILFEQFRYQRRRIYAMLGCAYLFSSLVAIPFLLTFPGALRPDGLPALGGKQSSVWVWHVWHIGFPILIALALAYGGEDRDGELPPKRIPPIIAVAGTTAVVLALATAVAATEYHESLPVLINGVRRPLSDVFYAVGGVAVAITLGAAIQAWRIGLRRRIVLHLWLAAVLTACLADASASLGAYARYTVGWYFGRVESMMAAGILLLAFLHEADRLYRHISEALLELSHANDQLAGMVTERDTLVTQLQTSEKQVRQLAYYDSLTDLPNRRLLLDRLGQALALARRHHYSMAVMFLDLDRFKQINDTQGHEAGDELLRQVARRWTGCMRSGDTVCRSGGDEFIVVLPEIAQPQDAALVAAKMIHALDDPVMLGEHPVKVSTSIGIAVYPIDGTDDVRELMTKADRAMYAAKAQGRNRFCFFGEMASDGQAAPVPQP